MKTPDEERLRKVMEDQNNYERGYAVTMMVAVIVVMMAVILLGIIILKVCLS